MDIIKSISSDEFSLNSGFSVGKSELDIEANRCACCTTPTNIRENTCKKTQEIVFLKHARKKRTHT